MKPRTKEIFQYSLAALVIIATIIWFGLMFFRIIPPENAQVINVAAGVFMGSGWTQVLNYFFGSSKGSADKNDLIKNNPVS